MPVAIVTDSAAALPPDLAEQLGVTVMPLHLRVGGRDHLDGEILLAEVLAHEPRELSTSGVTPAQVLDAVRARDDGDGVLVLTIARTMSSTFEAVRLAVAELQGEGRAVQVLDTETAAGAQGLVVAHAALAARRGLPLDEVAAAARTAADQVCLVATVGSLERLVASGRVSGTAALAGRLVNVNPLFEFRDGSVRKLRPAFTRDAALDRIASRWRRSRVAGAALHVAAVHALDQDTAEHLLKRVTDEVEPATAFVGEFSSVMVAHTGPGLVGLAWRWEPSF